VGPDQAGCNSLPHHRRRPLRPLAVPIAERAVADAVGMSLDELDVQQRERHLGPPQLQVQRRAVWHCARTRGDCLRVQRCLELGLRQTLDGVCVEPHRRGASKSSGNLTDADAERLYYLAMAAPQRQLLTKNLSQHMHLESLCRHARRCRRGLLKRPGSALLALATGREPVVFTMRWNRYSRCGGARIQAPPAWLSLLFPELPSVRFEDRVATANNRAPTTTRARQRDADDEPRRCRRRAADDGIPGVGACPEPAPTRGPRLIKELTQYVYVAAEAEDYSYESTEAVRNGGFGVGRCCSRNGN
jgi:hypothetical protein